MEANFDKIMDHILSPDFEGGYVNDPSDPGGETKYGISKRAFPKEDIKNLTPARAKEIYRAQYWNPINGDNLPDGIDFCVIDTAINSGVGTALKILKQSRTPDEYLLNRVRYYIEVGKKHPVLKKMYFFGWVSRVSKLRSVLWEQ